MDAKHRFRQASIPQEEEKDGRKAVEEYSVLTRCDKLRKLAVMPWKQPAQDGGN